MDIADQANLQRDTLIKNLLDKIAQFHRLAV